jgi:ceramide glucosyltransferase
MNAFAILLDGLAAVGAAQAWVASALVARFAGRPAAEPRALPPVTVLKPLYGDEALLEEALASFCTQDYPDYQIIFGLHARDDTALPVARRVAARFPGRDITLIVDPTEHGRNRKVGNLINMLPAARHDLLLIADSDIHVQPDYLRRLVAALETEGVGLATTLYSALAPDR